MEETSAFGAQMAPRQDTNLPPSQASAAVTSVFDTHRMTTGQTPLTGSRMQNLQEPAPVMSQPQWLALRNEGSRLTQPLNTRPQKPIVMPDKYDGTVAWHDYLAYFSLCARDKDRMQ